LHRAVERLAPEGVTVRSAPGFLAAAAGGEGLVRDEAVRRGAAVVVVVPGGADLLDHALLTAQAARAAGLAVPAVVVAGPGGAGQREALREHAGAEVHELPDPASPSGKVSDWPLGEWATAEPAGTAGAGAEDGIPVLAAYGGWEPHPVPDPRSAGRDRVDPVLLEVVAAEGPVLASRAFGLVNRAAGGMKLTTAARAPLSSSAYRLRHLGKLDLEEPDEHDQGEEVLRVAGSPPIRVRQLGPRALDEVPLAEIAELMGRLRELGCPDAGLPRAVLDTYGLVRMTAKAEGYLARAQALLD
jgi:hypothetical protein